MVYKIATRKSNLAQVQTDYVIREIEERFDIKCEKLLIETTGDKILDVSIEKIGGKGVFVKDIELALLTGKAQAAVHSMKDVPYDLDESFEIGAMPVREDPREALITAQGCSFKELPYGARIGTSSKRRIAQLKALRPDLEVVPMRGNVETRIEKMYREKLDGIVLALAGLKRLGLENKVSTCFTIEEIIPAIGQGALGVEIVKGNEFSTIVKALDNPDVRVCVEAERVFMEYLKGGCHSTIGAYGILKGNSIYMIGLFEVKGRLIKKDIYGSAEDYLDLGRQLAKKIING